MRKSIQIILLFLSTIAIAQIYDNFPTSTIWINNPHNGKAFQARSQTAVVFKNALINLVRSQRLYKSDVEDVAGRITYRISKINTQSPLTRNNGQKIYNGFRLDALENIDNSTDVVSSFVYDIDSKSLFYYDLDRNVCKLQYLPQSKELDRCGRYNEFDN